MITNENKTGYPSIDKPWLKYYSEEALQMSACENTVYELIYSKNSTHLSDVTMEYFGRKITYKTLFKNVEKVKKSFLANGVKKGDRVIMFTSATPELVYVVLALCRIGAVVNMINPVFTLEQIKARINETDAEIMLVLDQLFPKIQPIIGELCVKKTVVISVCNEMPGLTKTIASLKMKKKIPYDSHIIDWKQFMSEGGTVEDTPDVEYEKDMPLVMVYSSGTTGASKGIVLTNNGIIATISHYLSPDFPYNRGDVFLQMIPAWFSTGLVLSILMPICLGLTIVLEPMFSKENFAKGIKKHHPNMTLVPTSLWLYAMECEELQTIDLENMTYPFTGGEQVLPSVEIQINQFLKKHNCKSSLMIGYGMCELGSTVSSESLTKQKLGSTGFPMKGVTVAAFDMVTNKEMKYNERGEIRVDSPAHMKEYYKNPKATKEYFYEDEKGVLWGRTGDIGYMDEDGFIFILGRVNDTYTDVNGEIIYCFDIENEILRNDNVGQCEVVGLQLGDHEVPVVHLVLKNNESLSEKDVLLEIHNHCMKNLEETSIPCGYKIRKDFPVKSSGKRDMELIKLEREGFVLPTESRLEEISLLKKM